MGLVSFLPVSGSFSAATKPTEGGYGSVFCPSGRTCQMFFWTSAWAWLIACCACGGVLNYAIDYVNGYLGLYLGAKPKLN